MYTSGLPSLPLTTLASRIMSLKVLLVAFNTSGVSSATSDIISKSFTSCLSNFLPSASFLNISSFLLGTSIWLVSSFKRTKLLYIAVKPSDFFESSRFPANSSSSTCLFVIRPSSCILSETVFAALSALWLSLDCKFFLLPSDVSFKIDCMPSASSLVVKSSLGLPSELFFLYPYPRDLIPPITKKF